MRILFAASYGKDDTKEQSYMCFKLQLLVFNHEASYTKNWNFERVSLMFVNFAFDKGYLNKSNYKDILHKRKILILSCAFFVGINIFDYN